MTINKLRKHPTLGGIFGVYYQPDIIQTSDHFEILMPDIQVPQKINKEFVEISKNDCFMVRKQERWYTV